MKNKDVLRLAQIGVFMAIVLLLGLTPIGIIPLGIINLTVLHIPVIVGAIVLGWKAGLLLGATFGLTSFVKAAGLMPSVAASAMFTASPILCFIMSVLPRLLVPLVAYGVYTRLKKNDKLKKASMPVAAVCGSLTNTVFYLGLMLLFYAICGLSGAWSVIVSVPVLIGAPCEALLAAILTPPIVIALKKLIKTAQ
jgi:uncharacterized membrane protein